MNPADLSEDLLSGYVDDELDADTRAAVAARLATSPEWRTVLAEVQAARAAVRALPRVDLAPEAWQRLLAVVGADEGDLAAAASPGHIAALGRRVRRPPARWAGVAAMAAAAALIAAMVVPAQHQVTPKVATFSNDQTARASVAGDPVSALAGIGLMRGLGR